MERQTCDEAPIKELLKNQLHIIAEKIKNNLDSIENENICLLSDFERIGQLFKKAESLAASFYLQCYLSSFTSHYSDLSVCVGHLMERRHGALIVIERKDSLEEVLYSGVPIGAAISASLLEAIFYPGNPLHDGAVLVQGDRIASAANVLPLSSAVFEGKKIGMRHRAAIGLSERTDALVLVVSEESGLASFAYQGWLHPIHALETPHNPETDVPV
ncbi:sporulation-specific diadenylate cyclase CdaS [Cohnella zeiphila]|uniref:DNA integrity scanning protein DisA nucleotide-binding domain protein n=1 Tax=Cohnella zeiphila TaxID=2761120 RepID=A0A7X0SUZ3_9BACL|nr:DNA integrity scanning protein DisA nucleotide-binding domain protein [Cohnella zeiphila]